MANQAMLIYVGTYTRSLPHVAAKSEGIYLIQMDPATGLLEHVSKTIGVDNPSYVTLHPNGQYLYAVNEVGDYGGASSGAVSAFAIDGETGDLTFLNQEPTDGAAPCHLVVDAMGRYVLCANYSGGSVSMHPLNGDGSLGKMSDFVQHVGSSVNPQRQQGPHAHSLTIDESRIATPMPVIWARIRYSSISSIWHGANWWPTSPPTPRPQKGRPAPLIFTPPRRSPMSSTS
ncbi:MAG: beta-propeller fold lactonase family protein [Caldilineaceae bacterium]